MLTTYWPLFSNNSDAGRGYREKNMISFLYLFIYLFIYLSIYLFIYLFIYLSICMTLVLTLVQLYGTCTFLYIENDNV